MKLVALLCLAVVALAAPQLRQHQPTPIGVVRDERYNNGDGNFGYEFETEDGTHVQVTGEPGSNGGTVMTGSYRFTLPNDEEVEVQFVADEKGFRAESPHIHPLPAHAQEQVRRAEEEYRNGIRYRDDGLEYVVMSGYDYYGYD